LEQDEEKECSKYYKDHHIKFKLTTQIIHKRIGISIKLN